MKNTLYRYAAFIAVIIAVAALASSCTPPFFLGGPLDCGWFTFFLFPFGLIGTALYFLPIIAGVIRRKKNMLGIVLLNILAGWTLIGWIIALIWSLVPDKEQVV